MLCISNYIGFLLLDKTFSASKIFSKFLSATGLKFCSSSIKRDFMAIRPRLKLCTSLRFYLCTIIDINDSTMIRTMNMFAAFELMDPTFYCR